MVFKKKVKEEVIVDPMSSSPFDNMKEPNVPKINTESVEKPIEEIKIKDPVETPIEKPITIKKSDEVIEPKITINSAANIEESLEEVDGDETVEMSEEEFEKLKASGELGEIEEDNVVDALQQGEENIEELKGKLERQKLADDVNEGTFKPDKIIEPKTTPNVESNIPSQEELIDIIKKQEAHNIQMQEAMVQQQQSMQTMRAKEVGKVQPVNNTYNGRNMPSAPDRIDDSNGPMPGAKPKSKWNILSKLKNDGTQIPKVIPQGQNINSSDLVGGGQEKAIKAKKDFDIIWKITTGVFGFSTVGLLGGMFMFNGSMVWIGGTFTFFILFLLMFGFIMYLGKKTHAMLEFKAMVTGKPISLFFTDHKRIDWKVIEPEGNILVDEQYGAFLVNEKGAYVDQKTKNVFLAFNPAIGSNAAVECFKITDVLSKVLRDEKYLAEIREALLHGELAGEDIVFQINGKEERLKRFDKLKENVDFSHLKSILNTLIPHAINSKIEMTVQQRMGGASKINTAQIILVALSIIMAGGFVIMMLNMYGGGGGTTTIVKEVAAPVAAQAASTIAG